LSLYSAHAAAQNLPARLAYISMLCDGDNNDDADTRAAAADLKRDSRKAS